MPLPIDIQFDIIIYAFLSGILIGSMFDLYRIIRGEKVLKIIVVIEDILFWILVSMVVFTFLLYTNYAFLGFYVYLFMSISLFMYIKVISPIFIRIEIKILIFVSRIMRIIFKNFIYPFKLVFYSITGKK
jgi:spore cortex biosynthesis protein YabQ